MSILFTLKKVFDPAKAREEKEDQKNGRNDLPLGMAEGDGIPEVDVPEKAAQQFRCSHCGGEGVTNYCRPCLVFMDPIR